MKSQNVLIGVLVLTNLGLIGLELARPRAEEAATVAPVLRGHALELVDDQGRVRAEIKVIPALPTAKMPDGTTGYPESVLLRLINSRGGPDVKLTATEDGAGLSLDGESGYVQILSRGVKQPFIRVVTKDGREQVFKP